MKTLNQTELLITKIAVLENKQIQDFKILQNQYQEIKDNFKPLNFIKNSILEVAAIPNLKSYLISSAIGLGTNYLSKTFLNENNTNPIKKVLEKVVNFTHNGFVEKK